MKKLYMILLLIALEHAAETKANTRRAVATATASQTAAAAAALLAAQTANMSKLEQDLHECVKKFAPNFKDLTALNVISKKQVIENGRKELLKILQAADKNEKKKYLQAEAILLKLDVNKPWEATADFKKVLNILPPVTKKIISDTVSDLIIRTALGL